jgi:hypothetical protein
MVHWCGGRIICTVLKAHVSMLTDVSGMVRWAVGDAGSLPYRRVGPITGAPKRRCWSSAQKACITASA